MAACDYVVVATPYTPETDKLVSRAAVGAMRPNGVLVNVGRGKCVDEEALIEGGGGGALVFDFGGVGVLGDESRSVLSKGSEPLLYTLRPQTPPKPH